MAGDRNNVMMSIFQGGWGFHQGGGEGAADKWFAKVFFESFFSPINSQFPMIGKTWAIWFLSDYIPFLLHLVSSFTIASWQARLASVWVPRVQPARSHRGNHLRLRHPPLHCEWCWCWCWLWWWCWSTSNLIFTFPGDILLGNIARVQALQNFQHYCQRD